MTSAKEMNQLFIGPDDVGGCAVKPEDFTPSEMLLGNQFLVAAMKSSCLEKLSLKQEGLLISKLRPLTLCVLC